MAGKAWCCGGTGTASPGGSSSVVVEDTPSIDMEGDGTTSNPITARVKLSSDPGNIIVMGSDGAIYAPDGPVVIADTPSINVSGDGSAANPIRGDVVPDPAGPVRVGPNGVDVCVSTNAENVLHKDATGCLEVTAGDGLVPGPSNELDLCLSADAGNTATFGTDGCLFVPAGTGGGGLTTVATQDTPTVNLEGDGTAGNPVTATVIPDPTGPVRVGPAGVTVCLSADAGNSISLGSDGCLFAPPATGGSTTVVTGTPCISVTGTGTLADPYIVSPVIAPEPNGLECGPNGLTVPPSSDTGNTLTVGSDGRLFVPPSAGVAPLSGYITGPSTNLTSLNTPTLLPNGTFTAPESGTYHVTVETSGGIQNYDGVGTSSIGEYSDSYLSINGVPDASTSRGMAGLNWQYPDGTLRMSDDVGSATATVVVTLNAGETIQVFGVWSGAGAPQANSVQAQMKSLAWFKIA